MKPVWEGGNRRRWGENWPDSTGNRSTQSINWSGRDGGSAAEEIGGGGGGENWPDSGGRVMAGRLPKKSVMAG
jgi:hypothetical protein